MYFPPSINLSFNFHLRVSPVSTAPAGDRVWLATFYDLHSLLYAPTRRLSLH